MVLYSVGTHCLCLSSLDYRLFNGFLTFVRHNETSHCWAIIEYIRYFGQDIHITNILIKKIDNCCNLKALVVCLTNSCKCYLVDMGVVYWSTIYRTIRLFLFQPIIIDARGHLLGRLAAIVAKCTLQGKFILWMKYIITLHETAMCN